MQYTAKRYAACCTMYAAKGQLHFTANFTVVHGSGDFLKTLYFLPCFLNNSLSGVLKSHQIHSAYNRVSTLAGMKKFP